MQAIPKYKDINSTEDTNDHPADEFTAATRKFLQWMAIQLKDRRNTNIRAISDALLRMKAGTYGICKDCNSTIGEARLKALPTAERCIACQEDVDRQPKRNRDYGMDTPMGESDFPDGTLDHSLCTADLCCITGEACTVTRLDGGPLRSLPPWTYKP